MEQPKRQGTTTGNGSTKNPILAKENAPTEAKSKQSRKHTSIGDGSTKPRSLAEALSLLQSNIFDLLSMDCKTTILARENRVYVILTLPPDTGKAGIENGHITIDGKPVVQG